LPYIFVLYVGFEEQYRSVLFFNHSHFLIYNPIIDNNNNNNDNIKMKNKKYDIFRIVWKRM